MRELIQENIVVQIMIIILYRNFKHPHYDNTHDFVYGALTKKADWTKGRAFTRKLS